MKREVLIVGCGLIGTKRALALKKLHNLVGVVDINEIAVRKLADLAKVPAYTDFQSAIKILPRGSIVIICTPNNFLVNIAKIAIDRGCHVLIEKPGGTNHQELTKLKNQINNTNVKIAVGYNHRFHPAAEKLKNYVSSGEFGDVQLIRARYGHGGRENYETEWRANKNKSGGGELIDQGSHLLDLLFFLGFSPKIDFVNLPTLYWDIEVEDNAFIIGELGPKSKFSLHASWTEWKNLFSFEIFFKTAKVEWLGLGGSYGPETLIVSHMKKGLGIPEISAFKFPENDNSWQAEIIDFEKQITGKEYVGTTLDDALRILQLIDKCYSNDHL